MTFGSRRRFLWELGGGIAGLALCDLLKQDQLLASSIPADSPLLSKKTHFPSKANAVISLFMNGGTSHLDTFDPKSELTRRHLEAPPTSLNIQTFFPNPGTFLKSPFSFKKYGQSGIEVSELFSHTADCIDDIAVVRSMHALSNNHTPAILQMMTGFIQPGRPSLGAWTIYGLGSENQNLPAFVVLLDSMGGPLGDRPIVAASHNRNTDWTRAMADVTAPGDAAALQIWIISQADGRVWADGLSFKPVSGQPASNATWIVPAGVAVIVIAAVARSRRRSDAGRPK